MTEARTDDVGGLWLRVSRTWLAAGADLARGGTALGHPAASRGTNPLCDRAAHGRPSSAVAGCGHG
jgi:hypothetical protein